MDFAKSRKLQEKALRLIPGGAHSYAKGDDQYPYLAPGFIRSGEGCCVWDVDGNEFIEYGMGLRAVTLGHAFAPVLDAAFRAMRHGVNLTRPAPIEIECAESLLSLIDGAEMVKFAKDGPTANIAAVRLARAFTGRNHVVICDRDPFFSYNDWFIGTTATPAGIPVSNDRYVLRFRYNDIDSLRQLFLDYPDEIACVIFELERIEPPHDNFLAELRQLCTRHGALLIADENITGFRWHLGGAQKFHAIVPDLSTFGKAMGNGFAVSALTGRREVMELGGIRHDKGRVFLLSTTHGAETHALAAAVATMQFYKEHDVIGHLDRQGRRLRHGLREVAAAHGVAHYVDVVGRPCNLVYVARDAEGKPSEAYRTLFLQELIRQHVLAPSFVVSYAHRDEHIDRTVEAIDRALRVYRRALEDGVEKHLKGHSLEPVFRARG